MFEALIQLILEFIPIILEAFAQIVVEVLASEDKRFQPGRSCKSDGTISKERAALSAQQIQA